MDKKGLAIKGKQGFEMAVSTLIVLVLGILILIGFAYILTGGFTTFRGASQSFVDTATASAVKQGCTLACTNGDKITFCCKNYTVDGQKLDCKDTRLEVDCGLKCEGFSCK